jgi:hypothetical protein
MRVGVPKEIKNHEYRVGLTPGSVRELVRRGHRVIVQHGAGAAIGLSDEAYRFAGAELVEAPDEVFARAELIVKVKEPQPRECGLLQPGQGIFTYLHLAPDAGQAALLRASGATAIAYETVTDAAGGLPLLVPMSEVAGRMAIQAGATHLEKSKGGSGVLLGGVPGGTSRQGDDPRRWRGRLQCGAHRAGHRGAGDGHQPFVGPPALARQSLRGPGADDLFDGRGYRGRLVRFGSGRRGRPGSRCRDATPRFAAAVEENASRLRGC